MKSQHKGLLLAIALLLPGCLLDNASTQDGNERKLFVTGKVYVGTCGNIETDICLADSLLRAELNILSDPLPEAVIVNVNDTVPDTSTISIDAVDGISFRAPFSIAWGASATVEVVAGDYTGTATVDIPEPTVVTSHADGDSVTRGEELKLTWEGNADHYRIRGGSGIYRTDTVVSANELSVSASKMMSDASYMFFIVEGFNGPDVTAGEAGNFAGDASGFLIATNYSNEARKWRIFLYLK